MPLGLESLEDRTLLNATPVGPEFQVNTTAPVADAPGDVAAASDAAADFVIVCTSDAAGTNGDLNIYARRYNSAGVPQGNDFQVNATLNPTQSSVPDAPAVAMDAAGDFIVVWEKSAPAGSSFFYD